MTEEQDWVEVAAAGDDDEAEIIAGLLESENIPCEIEGPSASPWPENLGALGTARVMVPADRSEEAKALIRERVKDAEKNLSDSSEE